MKLAIWNARKARAWFSCRRERGDLNLTFLMLFFLVLGFLAFAVDASQFLTKKTLLENTLNLAREERMAPSVTLVAKNSQEPDAVIARSVAGTLRDANYQGDIDVYFYEVPEAQLPPSKRDTERVYAYQVVLTEQVKTVFASIFGVYDIPLKSTVVAVSNPYSEYKVWRPAFSRSTKWHLAANAPPASLGFQTVSLASMPEELRDAIGSQSANP